MPRIDAEGAAQQALDQYDTDKDGLLSPTELEHCQGILSALKTFDRDGDGMVSPEEISHRVEMYRERGVGLKMVSCKVLLNGRPLPGATVELIPESFLGEEVHEARGTSRSGGTVPLYVPAEALPSDLAGTQGVQLGVYKVKITHDSVKLPEDYTSGEGLGVEIGPSSHAAVFWLKKK
ncbi:MAG: EF-hand domain-containing protein [Planctomycetales bacterium]|nr:EF-hand domain-containing protein [Planctomycetales bacterium]